MLWFRWYHGTVSDPKFAGIARRAQAPLELVITIWAMILEDASSSSKRGSFSLDADSIAQVLSRDNETVERVLNEMRARRLIGVKTVPMFQVRNPRGDDSIERVRKYRQKRHADVTPVTRDAHVTVTPVTRLDERRVEETREDDKASTATTTRETVSDEDFVSEVIRVANRGMADNAAIGDRCQPITTSHGSRQDVHDWLTAGISRETVRTAVYDAALSYKSSTTRKQISTMKYFDGAVRDAHDRVAANTTEVPNGNGKHHARAARREGSTETPRPGPRRKGKFDHLIEHTETDG